MVITTEDFVVDEFHSTISLLEEMSNVNLRDVIVYFPGRRAHTANSRHASPVAYEQDLPQFLMAVCRCYALEPEKVPRPNYFGCRTENKSSQKNVNLAARIESKLHLVSDESDKVQTPRQGVEGRHFPGALCTLQCSGRVLA